MSRRTCRRRRPWSSCCTAAPRPRPPTITAPAGRARRSARLRAALPRAEDRQPPLWLLGLVPAARPGARPGEAQSMRQMIDHMLAEHHLDPAQVYVSGLSAGDGMASVMLATSPELFAGGAILAGLPYGSASGAREALASMSEPPVPAADSGATWCGRPRHSGAAGRGSPSGTVGPTTVAPSNAEAIAAQWTDLHGLDAAEGQETSVNGARRQGWRAGRPRHGRALSRAWDGAGCRFACAAASGRDGNSGPTSSSASARACASRGSGASPGALRSGPG